MYKTLIPNVSNAVNRIRIKEGLQPLELSFWEESKHPRGEHGRFASGNSGGSSESSIGHAVKTAARDALHHFLNTVGAIIRDPFLMTIIGGASLYYLGPIIASAASSAVSQYSTTGAVVSGAIKGMKIVAVGGGVF